MHLTVFVVIYYNPDYSDAEVMAVCSDEEKALAFREFLHLDSGEALERFRIEEHEVR